MLFFSGFFSGVLLLCFIGVKCSWGMTVFLLEVLGVYFIGNIFLKNVVFLDLRIVSVCMSGISEFIIKNL